MGKMAPVQPIRLVGIYCKKTLNLCDKLTYEGTKLTIAYKKFVNNPLTGGQYSLCCVELNKIMGKDGIYQYELGKVVPEGLHLVDHLLTNDARRAVCATRRKEEASACPA